MAGSFPSPDSHLVSDLQRWVTPGDVRCKAAGVVAAINGAVIR